LAQAGIEAPPVPEIRPQCVAAGGTGIPVPRYRLDDRVRHRLELLAKNNMLLRYTDEPPIEKTAGT
jgi:hypothetical protein